MKSIICAIAAILLAVTCMISAFPDEDWGYVNVDSANDVR